MEKLGLKQQTSFPIPWNRKASSYPDCCSRLDSLFKVLCNDPRMFNLKKSQTTSNKL